MSFDARHMVLGFALALAATRCGSFERGEPSPSDETNGDTDEGGDGATVLSFATDIYPILTAHCGSCHGSGGVASSSAYHLSGDAGTDYPSIVALVSVSAPQNSELLLRASGVSHGGGTVLSASSSEYQLIESWVAQGAPR